MKRVVLVCVVWLAACGGKTELLPAAAAGGSSVASDGGSGNSANATNRAGSGGGSGASGGSESTPPTCPAAAPAMGAPCTLTGATCSYFTDACSSVQFECWSGLWLQVPSFDGARDTCANFTEGDLGVPQDGQACNCFGTLDCTINECATGGLVHAVCDNTSWHVTRSPCQAIPCGPSGLTCKPGELCRAPQVPPESYTCVPDPCAAENETTSCQCASWLCGNQECAISEGVLSCTCARCMR